MHLGRALPSDLPHRVILNARHIQANSPQRVQGVVHVLLKNGAVSDDRMENMFIDALARKLNFTRPDKGAGSCTFFAIVALLLFEVVSLLLKHLRFCL